MESFKHLYLESCEHLKVKADKKLLLRIQDAGTGEHRTSLNLSNCQLSDDICKSFGQALSKDVHLRELDFSNCRLSQGSLCHILHGLERNKFLHTLNLKGNNIKSNGAQEIGKLLRHNNSLKQLFLEWNGLGISTEKFSLFCEGLTMNNSLEILDLRNNQLNHVSAVSISDALVRNTTLLKIDLRWNSVGLLGGRALHKAFTKNKTLSCMEISGNNIPPDTEESIMIASRRNAEQNLVKLEQMERTKLFSMKLQGLEEEKNNQIQSLILQSERKEQDFSEKERCNLHKFDQLKGIIAEKDTALQISEANCEELQRSVSAISSKLNDMALRLNEMEVRKKDFKVEYEECLSKERFEKEKMESKLLSEISSFKEENLFLKQQVQDLKTSHIQLEGQIAKLTGNIAKLEKQHENSEQQYNDQIIMVKEKHAEVLKENTDLKENEIDQLKQMLSNMEKKLQKHICCLEQEKKELEKQILVERKAKESEQTHHEELIIELKMKMKANEDKVKEMMEDRISLIENAKEKQEILLQEQLDVMYVLKKKITTLNLDITEKNIEAHHMQQCLSEKDEEMKAAVTTVNLEAKNQKEELAKLKEVFKLNSEEKEMLTKKLKDAVEEHRQETKMKDEVIDSLRAEISQKENKIREIVEEEAERTVHLQKAFNSYLRSENKQISKVGDVP